MSKNSPTVHLLRFLKAATILSIGGVLAGCSSDVMRFSDDFYTSAVPQGAASAQAENYGQPNYNPDIDRSITGSISSQSVQRSSLPSAPQASVAIPQPVAELGGRAAPAEIPPNVSPTTTASTAPAAASATATAASRAASSVPITTGSGWTSEGATAVTLRSGETIHSLSKRFGVPEKAILEVNGLSSASAAATGSTILIPTYSRPGSNSAPARKQEVAALAPAAAAAGASGLATSAPGREAVIADGGRYTVAAGDTLSAISRKTGASVAAIKQVNTLSSDAIRVGQRLIIPGLAKDSDMKTAKAQNIDPVVTGAVKQEPEKKEVAAYTPPSPAENGSAGSITKIETQEVAKAPDSTGVNSMRWPVQGRVINAFAPGSGGSSNDGIDISVPAGTPVKAAENGVVIYAGDGLKELGKTVLVRHADGIVTVYGNVSEISVKRGDEVRRGQQIAASGMSGAAKQPQLHFEVRKNSAPVDPVKFLQ